MNVIEEYFKLDTCLKQLETIEYSLSPEFIANKNAMLSATLDLGSPDIVYKRATSLRSFENVISNVDIWNESMNSLRDSIKTHMLKLSPVLCRQDQDRYNPDVELLPERVDYNSQITQNFINTISSLISSVVDWRFAAADINPMDGKFTKMMVAADPLYIVSENATAISRTKELFNPIYSDRRLFDYDRILELPSNQLGLVVNINRFEYMPINAVNTIIEQVFQVLRPGGKFIFSYNDCNTRGSLKLIEHGFRCYNTFELMNTNLITTGFSDIKHGCENDAWSWIITTKPGLLTSNKASSIDIKLLEQN